MPPMRATEPPARHQAPGGRGLAWLMDTVTTGNPEPGARWSLMLIGDEHHMRGVDHHLLGVGALRYSGAAMTRWPGRKSPSPGRWW